MSKYRIYFDAVCGWWLECPDGGLFCNDYFAEAVEKLRIFLSLGLSVDPCNLERKDPLRREAMRCVGEISRKYPKR